MSEQIGNIQLASGAISLKNIVKAFIVPTFDDAGVRNTIPVGPLTKAVLDANLTKEDISQRWQPLPIFNDALLPKADTVFDTAADGTNFRVRDGIRSFTGMFKGIDSVILKGLEVAECGPSADWSIFLVDRCGIVVTEEVDAGIGRPLQITPETFDAIYHYMTNDTANDVTIQFDFGKLIKDSRLTPVNVDEDADILKAKGVVSVNAVISAISLTGYTMTCTFDTGFLGEKVKFVGALAADFELNEISPVPGSITITTVVETPALSGIYVVVHPAATDQDVLETTSSAAGIIKKFELRPVRHIAVP